MTFRYVVVVLRLERTQDLCKGQFIALLANGAERELNRDSETKRERATAKQYAKSNHPPGCVQAWKRPFATVSLNQTLSCAMLCADLERCNMQTTVKDLFLQLTATKFVAATAVEVFCPR